MKKVLIKSTALFFIVSSLSSCATLFGGQIGSCQRTKPVAGQPSRQIRGVALVLDILIFWPGLILDFANGSIYKPCPNKPEVSLKN